MPVCSVITCKYSQDDCDPELDGIVFHRFPKNEETRAKWIDMTGHDKWIPSYRDAICSRHFRDNDYFIKRSGKRYLKTAAIPCEYVVYRIPDDDDVTEVTTEAEAEANEVEEVSVYKDQEPKVEVQHEPQVEYEMTPEPQPGPSHWFTPQTSRATSSQQQPDSTIATIYDNENSQAWDRFQPERYFGQRLPASIFEDSSQEVDSSDYDDRFQREDETVDPYPAYLDLRPHLQLLPPPRTPEPYIPVIDEPESNSEFETEEMRENASSPVTEILRGHKKLEDIRKIMSKSKTGKKAVAAGLAAVLKAQSLNEQLESGEMSDVEKANAIMDLQTKRIIKLDMQHRRLKKILKRISAVLRA